jgi:hypothetical protein
MRAPVDPSVPDSDPFIALRGWGCLRKNLVTLQGCRPWCWLTPIASRGKSRSLEGSDLVTVKGLGARVASAVHNRPEGRRSMRRRLAILFVFATAAASMSGLSSCGEAKEDPAVERRREVQQQVQQPEQTLTKEAEQTDRTVGENIEG